MKDSALLGTLHALITIAVGVRAIASFRTPEKVLYVLGYVVASEPLWRLSGAMIFSETAKYVLAGLSILALERFRLWTRADKTPLLFFLLLLPSLLVMPQLNREEISFNLSGPFALSMATLFMGSLQIPKRVLAKIFLVSLAPIVGLAFVATFSTLTTESINFYASKVTAGGLGKNQGSSILGLGGVLSFLFLFVERRYRTVRWTLLAIGIWLVAQAALTFSRGGVITAIGAITAAGFYLLQDRHSRGILFIRIGLILALATFMIIPFINTLTSGTFKDRFTDTNLTGRDKLIRVDLKTFSEAPLLGVGPGGSKDQHSRYLRSGISTHTEYSRLLAEHGSFGLVAILIIFQMTLRRLRRPASPLSKAIAACLTAWSLLFMVHAAMRMAAASFTFALGAAYILTESRRASPSHPRLPPKGPPTAPSSASNQ